MVVTIVEDNNTLKYQETINVDVENIASKNLSFWRPIDEVIENSYFEATNLLPAKDLDQCRDHRNELHNIPNEIKTAVKKMAME